VRFFGDLERVGDFLDALGDIRRFPAMGLDALGLFEDVTVLRAERDLLAGLFDRVLALGDAEREVERDAEREVERDAEREVDLDEF